MQNAGQHYGQGGGVPSHQQTTANSNYGHTESPSITSSLRQFRRKQEPDKHPQPQELNQQPQIPDSHVARVAPHSHYPSVSRPGDCYRYPPQYPEYSVPSQVKYSEISEPHQPIQEHVTPSSSQSVIQKAKGKDYMDMCSIQQSHVMKQPYPDHMGPQQPYADHNVLPQSQYIPKEAQIHSLYKQQESQYFPKDHQQFQGQLPHQMPKYNVPPSQMHKDFLSQLQKIHPTMARAIMNDHHMKEAPPPPPPRSYQNIGEQNRIYNQPRYVNHPTSPIQGNIYPHGYGPPPPQTPQASYPNYPSSCSYTRAQQMPPRFPPINPHERSISPRRNYSDGMNMPMNYPGMPQKISPNYPSQYNSAEYPQHFQQRRGSMPQEYYQQHCRPTQYIPHQLPTQDLPDSGRVTVSDNIKQYIENWAEEETATEMNQMENNRLCKENARPKEGQSNETIYAINASDLQYLEPIVGAETGGIPVVTSENGQYILKSGVSLDNTSGMLRLVDKTDLVNLQIMDPSSKPDCMLAKTTVPEVEADNEKSRIVIHQNTVIQSGTAATKEKNNEQVVLLEEELDRTIIRENKKETADKNLSPINLEHGNDDDIQDKVMYPSKKVVEEINCKNMPIIESTASSEQAEDLSKSEELDLVPFEEPTTTDLSRSPSIDESNEPASPLSSPSPPPQLPEEPKASQISTRDEEKPKINNDLEPSEPTAVVEDPNNLESLDLSMKYDVRVESKPKRTRRFFSVDDIINNIGSSLSKSSQESEERRHSIQTTTEFLSREVRNTFVRDAGKLDRSEVVEENNNKLGGESAMGIDEEVEEAAADAIVQKVVENEVSNDQSIVAEATEHITTEIEDVNVKATNENDTMTETIPDVTKDHDEEPTLADKPPANKSEPDKAGQEVQYRNVIRVDESNVVLHIAGELVEVNVHMVNGKKMITVVPLSNSSVADLNDNYETLDGNEATIDRSGDDDNAVGDADYEENSKPENLANEVIIGMDLSLEEEIQLDLEQPQVVCTKAAKKAYDCDLQIPSITTSEDVLDAEDKKIEETVVVEEEKSEQEVVADEAKTATEDEEFVPFKDLIKARKLRKMRMKATKNDSIKADSTNKIEDEGIGPVKKSEDLGKGQVPNGGLDLVKKEQSPKKEPVPTDKPNLGKKEQRPKKEPVPTDKPNLVKKEQSPRKEHILAENPIQVKKEQSLKKEKILAENHSAVKKEQNPRKESVPTDKPNLVKNEQSPRKEQILAESPIPVKKEQSPRKEQISTDKLNLVKKKQSPRKEQIQAENPSAVKKEQNPRKESVPTDTPNLVKNKQSPRKEQILAENPIPVKMERSPKKEPDKPNVVQKEQNPWKEQIPSDKPNPVKKEQSPRKEQNPTGKPNSVKKEQSPKKEQIPSDKPSLVKKEHSPRKEQIPSDKSNLVQKEQSPRKETPTDKPSVDKKETDHAKTEEFTKRTSFREATGNHPSTPSKESAHKSPTTYQVVTEHKSPASSKFATVCKEPEYKSVQVLTEHKSSALARIALAYEDSEQNCGTAAEEHESSNNAPIRRLSVCKESDERNQTVNRSEHKRVWQQEPKVPRSTSRVDPRVEMNQKTDAKKKKLSLEEYNRRKRRIEKDEEKVTAAPPAKKRSRDDSHVPVGPPGTCLAAAKIRFGHRGKSLDEPSKRRVAEPKGQKRSYDDDEESSRPRRISRCKDEILQIYKDQVESKLSSLNIQIPRVAHKCNQTTVGSVGTPSQPEPEPFPTVLMERFLRNEHLTPDEMQKVRKIVTCKRLAQQLKTVRTAYAVDQHSAGTKLHLKKLPPERRARKRFRNLYGGGGGRDDSSTEETDSDDSKNQGDYSVVQSNCLAGVVPKLIIKRKPDATLPFVKLERLDMRLLVDKKYGN